MKKRIVALGPRGTYGHEATLKAIQEFNLGDDCEIVFVGTNQELVTTAIREECFALVPVENSTAGVVVSAVPELFRLMSHGSKVSVIGELNLHPSHYLLARSGIGLGDIRQVLSHRQAIEQCQHNLSQIGQIGVSVASTAKAAEMVASEDEYKDCAALASVTAAKEYGLVVIARHMADDPKNRTRFYLVGPKDFPANRQVRLTHKKIGIIGITGRFGKWLEKFFRDKGCTVTGSDVDTILSNREVIEVSDVVCFAVSLAQSELVIRSLAKFGRPEQLWLDVTGIKAGPVKAMLESRAEVVGMHPMCAPTVKTLRGQTLVISIGRLEKWGLWFHDLLCNLETDVKLSSPEDHDRAVACVQTLPHAAILAMASTIASLGVDAEESLGFTSPFYRVIFSLMGRLLKQDPGLYADMQMVNPHALRFLMTFRDEIDQLIRLVETNDRSGFIQRFRTSQDHFGTRTLNQGFEFFEHLIQRLVDLAEANSIRLVFEDDHPGLLNQIEKIFADEGINQTAFHSSRKGGKLSFLIGLEQPKFSPVVVSAVERIKAETGAEVEMSPSVG